MHQQIEIFGRHGVDQRRRLGGRQDSLQRLGRRQRQDITLCLAQRQ
jgi:hypothetical protein